MILDFDKRSAALGVGDFSDFTLGPRGTVGIGGGLWRAQLGSHWHRQLQKRTLAESPAAEFELPVSGRLFHRGWTITLNGRMDQRLKLDALIVHREIKTVLRTLPAPESELRAEYPSYFLQLSAYRALIRMDESAVPHNNALGGIVQQQRWELVFVEADTGLAQTVLLDQGDAANLQSQLDRLVQFLESRRLARERLRHLLFRPAFSSPRPGQEHTVAALANAIGSAAGIVLFEAPTGFGKTGVMLEAALAHLRQGHFERLVYLSSKATGQLQVQQTLDRMFDGTPAGVWVVRPKSEHCIHTRFHCVRSLCPYLDDLPGRWQQSGLARTCSDSDSPRDLESLRTAGLNARLCPFEITRTALSCNEIWIGDINYVFSPAHRSLFFDQPAFLPSRTLLIVDEAHNLPSRVADVYSHTFSDDDAEVVRAALASVRAPAPLLASWDQWHHYLRHCRPTDRLTLAQEDDALDLLKSIAKVLTSSSLDYSTLEPEVIDQLWEIPSLLEQMENHTTLPRLWWCPKEGRLSITCLDAAEAIGKTLGEFGGALLASATFGPLDVFRSSLGLDQHMVPHAPPQTSKDAEAQNSCDSNSNDSPIPDKLGKLTKRETKKLFSKLTRAADLLQSEESRGALLTSLKAETPWRTTSYAVACDLRVDTSFQHREGSYELTAATVVAFADSVCTRTIPRRPLVVFFPSYAYAACIHEQLRVHAPDLTVTTQPRGVDLAAQQRWLSQSLTEAFVIQLVLGSSFAEGIDLLGGSVAGAMVVGPALPEVNALQRAKLAHLNQLGRSEAVRRVYQIPGMQKVNQALGRLVRAPGQTARVLLHCRRFADPVYQDLLHEDFRSTGTIACEKDLMTWLHAT